MTRYWREAALILIGVVMLAGLWARGPIPQDAGYHDFADQRLLLGVPNLLDVVSNLAFLIVGVAGIVLCVGRRRPPLAAAGLNIVYRDRAGLLWLELLPLATEQ